MRIIFSLILSMSIWSVSFGTNTDLKRPGTSDNYSESHSVSAIKFFDSIIINKYTPVISFDQCKNTITVENASDFNVGDTVLMIQMKGAVIDSSNTPGFGNITDYRSAGNYEFNYVKSKTGNTIELLNNIIRTYELPDGKVQLVRVPYYHNITFNSTLTADPWDGSKGGILALNVKDTLTLNENIDITAKGLRGGKRVTNSVFICDVDSFFIVNNNGSYAAAKGEGIASTQRLFGRGKLANGGGGGNATNSGGAGGGNGGTGGIGGQQFSHWAGCTYNNGFANGGIGGSALQYSNISNKIFLGGGGGGGHDNEALSVDGGNGGGIAILSARVIRGNSFTVISNGFSPQNPFPGNAEDGRSGGGSGGTVLLNYTTILGTLNISVKGGNGDFTVAGSPITSYHGPGGGGGGGVVWVNAPSFASLNTDIAGGSNGVNIYYSNNPWGATPGSSGLRLNNLILPISTEPFKQNIDSVRFSSVSTSCRSFNFLGSGYTNTDPIASWQWNFGDGNTANSQNPSHTYSTTGTFNVKLVVTDINGCKDSIIRAVNSSVISAFAGNDASYCSSTAISHQLIGTGGNSGNAYSWQPAALLNDPGIANPIATVNTTTTFYFTINTPGGCTAIDSVIVNVTPLPVINTFSDTAFCVNTILNLHATGATTYLWAPASAVSDPNIANPVFTGTTNQIMTVTGINGPGCDASSSFLVTVKEPPTVTTIPDSMICSDQSIVLTTTGAQTYSWAPPTSLSNPNIANPIFSGVTSTTYTVAGTAANGCTNTDNIIVTVVNPAIFNQPPDTAVCINSTVTLKGNNGTGVNYQWSPATGLSNTTISNPVFTPSTTGSNTFSLLINEPVCNSNATFQVTVLVNALPTVAASRSNDLDCNTRTASLNATGAETYTWAPASTLNNPNTATPVASPQATTLYTVTGTDNNGCMQSASVEVKVGNKEGGYYIPNAFTPNGDGLNDCFGVKHWGDVSEFYFIIYNRWGEKVFETRDVNNCWDGRYKGRPLQQGNYVYYIKSTNACSEQVKKGNVILIR